MFLLLTLLLFASSFGAVVQYQSTKPANCESDIAILDLASSRAGDDGLIIAVARLGDGERQRSVNLRRLHNVRVYLTQWNGRRNPKTVVLAEGEAQVVMGELNYM
jgi:hypothetical protein